MAEYVVDSLAVSKGQDTFILDPAEIVEPILEAKADKVDGATSGNFAGLDANGNLIDSGHKHSDYATLDSSGKVPSSQLPSYVDDVLEYDTRNNFPATGESGKIYIAKDTNKTYRWSGSTYIEVSESLALGETSSTAYRGDRGKVAYDHASDSSRLTTAQQSGLYKIATTSEGHVASVTPATKNDITSLGIVELPSVTASDNGSFLRVVNGAWAKSTVPNANGVNF